jgi:hypothetical protein
MTNNRNDKLNNHKKDNNNHDGKLSMPDDTSTDPVMPVIDQHYMDMFDYEDPKKTYDSPDLTVVGDPTMSYDSDEIKEFLDVVFHTTVPTDNILMFSAEKNTPSYPVSAERGFKKLKRSTEPRSWYYGTATVEEDLDGKLFNRKSQFTGLHVVVLDDIGTKIDASILPKDLLPNYIIESSAGNFQYGYVLKEPLRDLAQAEALIHLVYTSGYSDEGGKLATKVVRLPCGRNGKPTAQRDFKVNLQELNDDYWDVAELVDVLNVGITWDQVLTDPEILNKSARNAKISGTSLWSPIPLANPSLDGIVDPVLEWLYETGSVLNDVGPWVTLPCPWEHEHTAGEKVAGYSPVGRGGEYNNLRSFKCFHGHCAHRTIHDFLPHIAALGAPVVPVFDYVADLVADYAFITSENAACRIRGVNVPTSMKMDSFKNAYPRTSMVYEQNGKMCKVADSKLWLTAPNRLTLDGRVYDPTNSSRVVRENNLNQLNTYTAPTWGTGEYDQDDVDMFMDFITYLVPDDKERDYFMQWMSAKCQDVTFKGACLLMVAPIQGTGRTTLTDMVSTLFMFRNTRKVNFKTLCSASEQGTFNDWQESIMVTCDEVMSTGSQKYEVYEGLKDLFDPKAKEVTINTKYGTQRTVQLYTSYIMLTNHTDAIGALGGDRRVYVISNAINKAPVEYFVRLNKWLDVRDDDGKPKWAKSIWRYMQTLPNDLKMLHDVTPITDGKLEMIQATGSLVDAVAASVALYMGDLISVNVANTLAENVLWKVDASNAESFLAAFKHAFKNTILPMRSLEARHQKGTVSGKSLRFSVNRAYVVGKGLTTLKQLKESDVELLLAKGKKHLKFIIDEPAKAVIAVVKLLELKGY